LGKLPENALFLMRSRYCAYALHLADYIMHTTFPKEPAQEGDPMQWKSDIIAFSQATQFQDLSIIKFIDGPQEAYVTFTAHLKQKDIDATFTEKSHFVKVDDCWLYESGQILNT
jgi:SEC-C motif-containing protein